MSNDDELFRRMFCDPESGIRNPSTTSTHAIRKGSRNIDKLVEDMIEQDTESRQTSHEMQKK
jgi:hypothetical protein